MSRRSQTVVALDAIHAIRATRETLAQHAAGKAAADAREAQHRLDEEAQRRDDAFDAWTTVATQSHALDPLLLASWSHEIARCTDAHSAAEATCTAQAAARDRERQSWIAATVQTAAAAGALKKAQRRLESFREEAKLAEQADIAARRVRPL